jgi:hypothetical protein
MVANKVRMSMDVPLITETTPEAVFRKHLM